jgi:hypothetical protein
MPAGKVSGYGKKGIVLNFVRNNPGCSKTDICAVLNLPATNVGYNLGLLKKEKLLRIEGRGTSARWQVTSKASDNAPSKTPCDVEITPPDPLKCKLCNTVATTEDRLKSHMRVVHDAASL